MLDLRRFPEDQLDRILDSLHVTDLWGVAGRSGKRLAALGIHTAKELRDADATWLRKRFSVVMERIILELRGQKCIELETQPPAAKDQLIYSRSFSRKLRDPDEMHQVLSIYAQRVSARLRAQGSVAGVLTGLRAADGIQFLPVFQSEFEDRGVGEILDKITRKLGPQSVGVGLGGMKTPPGWEMKRAMLSKRCTTHWDELPVAVA